jgi:hypothetical protein
MPAADWKKFEAGKRHLPTASQMKIWRLLGNYFSPTAGRPIVTRMTAVNPIAAIMAEPEICEL